MLAASYDLLILLSLAVVAVGIPITVITEVLGAKPAEWIQQLLFMTVAYAYFVGFWHRAGQTTGMRPWKLRVAMADSGDNPSLAAATIRFFGMIITWLAFALIFFYVYALSTNNAEVFDKVIQGMVGTTERGILVPGFLVIAMIPAMNMLLMIMTPRKQTLYDLAAGTSIYRVE